MPFKNRSTAKVMKFGDKLERAVTKKPMSNAGCIIRLRPVVSARNPQKCELVMTPAKETAPIMPCSR